jgi:lipoprotein-anchoring transpeptidase ErfK/SrfK
VRRVFLAAMAIAILITVRPVPAQDAQPLTDPAIRYRSVPIEGPQSVTALRKQLGAEGFLLVLKINRLDLEHVRQGTSLLVPERVAELLSFSPFPLSVPIDISPASRLLVVSRRVQAFAAYENGALVRWGPTSTGRKETPTPVGLYHTNWRAKLRRSSDNAQWILPWLWNFDNARGVSFHQFDLPGYPASHACVRLLEDDARWIFDFAEPWVLSDDRRTVIAHGTPVVVFGEYAYDATPPWKRLGEDPLATTVGASEIAAAIDPFAVLIAERARLRAEIASGKR